MKYLIGLSVVLFVCPCSWVLAGPQSLPCYQQLQVADLPNFKPARKNILSDGSLQEILKVRQASEMISQTTLLVQIGEILLADPVYKRAHIRAPIETSAPILQNLVGNLLRPVFDSRHLVLLVALAELDLYRNYTAGHFEAMSSMGEILRSDPPYAPREDALLKEHRETLVVKLIVGREVDSVAKVMDQYCVDHGITASP